MKSVESLAAVKRKRTSFANEKSLVAFLYPKIKIKISKVTHTE